MIDPANLASMPILKTVPGYPYVNHISGDASYHLTIASMNAGIDLTPDWSLYSVATYGKKKAEAFENYRMPNRLPKLYPLGFNPKEAIDEDDFQFTLGANGKLGEWNLDLSSTFGQDKVDIMNIHSGNVSLYNDTGSTPTDFHNGQFIATQWTSNLDLSRGFDIGWASPLNVAFGAEHREDTYEIGAGDPASRYKEGSQAYPGFLLTDAGHHSRNNNALYADFAGSPIAGLKLDAAARFEHFSDFGSARVGKLTGRYDFSPQVAIRSTISNGFRAPTMAEQYYSATNVSPTSAFVQLGAELGRCSAGRRERAEAGKIDQLQPRHGAAPGQRRGADAGRVPDHDPRPHRRLRRHLRFGRRDQLGRRHCGDQGQRQRA